MKKVVVMALILGILLMPFTVRAEEKGKAVDVELSAVPDRINLGESVTLTASTPKHGSASSDSWTNAEKTGFVYDPETGLYESTAEFTPAEAGTFEIVYRIDMTSGKSGVVFTGIVKTTLTVVDTKKVTGAEIKIMDQSAVVSGALAVGYRVTGEAYALWSDGSETDLNQVVFLFFKPNETQKMVPVSFTLEGADYRFNVAVSRGAMP